MTRAKFCKELAERTGIPKKTIQEVIEAEENLVYEIMATCDSIKYIWGTVSGIEKPPKKIGGTVLENKNIWDNKGWSAWKIGYPNIKWSTASKICEKKTPQEFFEQPENRYTSKARMFRKDLGLPEIPEFIDLPEEKILEICAKADERDWQKLTRQQQKDKLKDDKYNTIKKIAVARYWEETGYKPRGALYREDLGDLNYTGEQRDVVSTYLIERVESCDNLPEKLEVVLSMTDYAESRGIVEKHPELKELEEKFRKEIKEAGLQEIPHQKREMNYQTEFTLSFLKEKDPWNINQYMSYQSVEGNRRKRELTAKSEEEISEILKDLNIPEYARQLSGRINYWEVEKILEFAKEIEEKERAEFEKELDEAREKRETKANNKK